MFPEFSPNFYRIMSNYSITEVVIGTKFIDFFEIIVHIHGYLLSS